MKYQKALGDPATKSGNNNELAIKTFTNFIKTPSKKLFKVYSKEY